MKIVFIVFLLMTCVGPLWIDLSKNINFKADYRTANRESSYLAPLSKDHVGSIVQIYAARAFNWRGIFALHLWLAIKPKNESFYSIYHVIGWRSFQGLPALSVTHDIPDRYWFDQKPVIIFYLRDEQADKIIPKIKAAVNRYPFSNEYRTWPGPNSNTFIAYIAREIPEMRFALPSIAIGKDFTGNHFFTKAPSGTGYQFSLYGCFGIMLAVEEGLEINILGLVYGINPLKFTIKLPGIGDVNFKGPLI